MPHSWHLDPCKYTSPTRPIKVATRTRQDDANPTGKDRVLLSRGSLVRVQPGAPFGRPRWTRRSNPARALRVQRAQDEPFRILPGPRARPRTGRAAGRQKRRSTDGRHRTSRGRHPMTEHTHTRQPRASLTLPLRLTLGLPGRCAGPGPRGPPLPGGAFVLGQGTKTSRVKGSSSRGEGRIVDVRGMEAPIPDSQHVRWWDCCPRNRPVRPGRPSCRSSLDQYLD